MTSTVLTTVAVVTNGFMIKMLFDIVEQISESLITINLTKEINNGMTLQIYLRDTIPIKEFI